MTGGIGNISKQVFGGLVGVAAAKFIPTMIPTGLLPSVNVVRVALSVASAFVSKMIAQKIAPNIAEAVFFGGLMQAGSDALNAFLPGIGGRFALASGGMGELMPGNYVVPQNPLRIPPAVPTNARITVNGLGRSFGTAF